MKIVEFHLECVFCGKYAFVILNAKSHVIVMSCFSPV